MGTCCACHNSYIDWQANDILLKQGAPEKISKWVPPVSRCMVISVYDGDTITVGAFIGQTRYAFKCRLDGIDTAEMRGSGPAEKAAAVEAKNALADKILGKCVTLGNVSLEKYGRLLAEVWYKGESVNKWLVEERYAVPYDGKAKEKVDWGSYRIAQD